MPYTGKRGAVHTALVDNGLIQQWRMRCITTRLSEESMKIDPRFSIMAALTLCLGSSPVRAQVSGQGGSPVNYECVANSHCSISCSVDGEKQVQTGSPKTVTITLLAPNNYLVELVEQSGHTQFAYLAGAKVACSLEGVTKMDK
jgi:hypothetical protein